ncbi:MAG: aldolase catalytic domain-containing protein [Candidatus Pacebacteria bacterium]|nr:aldolase catalytic domain-containing protein [Candidatus Paceibacterota bacterium]
MGRRKDKMKEISEKQEGQYQKDWIGYRPEIRVLDCTVRDGGLMNDHLFSDDAVRAVYQTCVKAGIDYMELGYKASKKIFTPKQFGIWKFCDEDDVRRIVGDNDGKLKLSVMADAERTDYHEDILPKKDSVLDMIRVATYIHQIPIAIDMIKDAADKGYETTCNIMAISTVQEGQLRSALDALAETPVGTIYVVDSFGSLYSEQIRDFTLMYLRHVQPAGKEVGIHTHNNQQLAYANTVEALIQGANRLDASLAGLGRGAGNCPIELLVGFLHNPKLRLRPLLQCIKDHIEPMHERLRWGFGIPYMITGLLNQHPREAMKFMEETDTKDIVNFFDSMAEEE